MKSGPNDQDIVKALDWHKEHRSHVDAIVLLSNSEYPPSGSDCIHPELWKAEHWKWLLTRDVATLDEIRKTVERGYLKSAQDGIPEVP